MVSDRAVAFADNKAVIGFQTASSIVAVALLVTCTRSPLSEALYCGYVSVRHAEPSLFVLNDDAGEYTALVDADELTTSDTHSAAIVQSAIAVFM